MYIAALSTEEREALDDEGLRLYDHLSESGYDSTPRGHLAFASTGGDGVHFSFPRDQPGPVVMTVPMMFDRPNIVVGSDLADFLSLGCVFGYFGLEQLAYDMDRATNDIEAAGGQCPCLYRLSRHFNLRPWRAVRDRLDALKLTYPLHDDCS